MIRTTGAERLSRKMRKFVVELPDLAGQAATEAAYEEVVPEIKSELETQKHVWTGRLKNSVRAIATNESQNSNKKQKYVSVQIDYGDLPYADKFETGGMHRDWPLSRLREWIKKKENLDEKEAKIVARKIQKSLGKKGAKSYPILETVWNRTFDRWFQSYSIKLRQKIKELGF